MNLNFKNTVEQLGNNHNPFENAAPYSPLGSTFLKHLVLLSLMHFFLFLEKLNADAKQVQATVEGLAYFFIEASQNDVSSNLWHSL